MTKRGPGEGSIYRRKDGRWTAENSLEGGKSKFLYGKTRKEVQEKLKTALYEQQQGMLVTGPQQQVGQFLTQWLEEWSVMALPSVLATMDILAYTLQRLMS